jgi:DNA-binding NtrC family response regulator
MSGPIVLLAEAGMTFAPCLREAVSRQTIRVVESSGESDSIEIVRSDAPMLALVGCSRAEPFRGLDIARRIRTWGGAVRVVLVVESSCEELAIAALRAGVDDYLRAPLTPEIWAETIRRWLAEEAVVAGVERGGVGAESLSDGDRMVGRSFAIETIKAYIGKVASTDSTVLITGETGTGKDLVAQLIHRNSPRRRGPFICINCAALPDGLLESELFGYERGAFTGAAGSREGKLEAGDGGTIFLDEIGDMSPYAQAAILRAIESKEIQRLGGRARVPLDVRVVAATNKDLEQVSSRFQFRQDLFFRLNVGRIHVPPLRSRTEDIPPLVDHFFKEYNGRYGRDVRGLSAEILPRLIAYDWPGNVRELKNLMEAAYIESPGRWIHWPGLPEPFRRKVDGTRPQPVLERERLMTALLAANWNKSKAAQALRWSRMTLYRKMAKYRIEGAGAEARPWSEGCVPAGGVGAGSDPSFLHQASTPPEPAQGDDAASEGSR